MSGAIKTSDAEQLWAESKSIRQWSSERISQLNGLVSELQDRVDAVEKRNTHLLGENERLISEIGDLNVEILRLRREVATGADTIENLTTKLKIAQDRVDVLEESAGVNVRDRRKEGG